MKFKNLDSKQSFQEQYKTTLTFLALESIMLILSLSAALTSVSLYVWIDTIESLVAVIQPLLVVLVLRSIMNDHMEDKYNYGTGRIECISGVVSNVLNITCLSIAFVVAILNIQNPTQPSAAIGAFLLLKIVDCVNDKLFVLQQTKIHKKSHGAISAAAMRQYEEDFYYDLVILIIGIPCFVFRNMMWSWYLSPIASMAICLYSIVKCSKQTMQFIRELSDASIPLAEQIRIFDIVLEKRYNTLKSINSVNTHTFDDTIHVDIDVDFLESVSCKEEEAWLKEVGNEILKESEQKYKISIVHHMKKETS